MCRRVAAEPTRLRPRSPGGIRSDGRLTGRSGRPQPNVSVGIAAFKAHPSQIGTPRERVHLVHLREGDINLGQLALVRKSLSN
jgi:hypothetical protein